jgi:hypothetical protein
MQTTLWHGAVALEAIVVQREHQTTLDRQLEHEPKLMVQRVDADIYKNRHFLVLNHVMKKRAA